MLTTKTIRRGSSAAEDEDQAVQELATQLDQDKAAHTVFFCSSHYDLDRLGAAIAAAFGENAMGCTTAGEITPTGYAERSITGFSIHPSYGDIATYLLEPLQGDFTTAISAFAQNGNQRFRNRSERHLNTRAFGLLLVDGLSAVEEQVVGQLHAAFRDLPLIGGSAGDGLNFKQTHVYWGGRFWTDAAVFALVMTDRPFHCFKAQHFAPTDKKMVITRAIPEKRVVTEINGRRAADEYARLVGMNVENLESQTYSQYPVMLRIGGDYHVRSIKQADADGSLTFYCAIDEGLVLTVAEGRDLVEELEITFANIRQVIPDPELVIGCECILRRLEVIDKNLTAEVDRLMTANNVLGFHTYGEQFGPVHVNQTLTGIALGS